GSTGQPKGVPVSHKNLNAFVNAFFDAGYKLNENDRFLQMFDLSFDLSVISYLIPLLVGACVYTVGDEGIKYIKVAELLEEQEITFAMLVPSVLAYLRPYFTDIYCPKLR